MSILRRTGESPRPNPSAVTAFSTLHLVGAAGLLVVVSTAVFCKRIKRWATWYSFCVSWIVSSISYSLLTIAGQQSNESPDTTLCLIQAAGIYAAPPLTTCTTFSFIIHILLRLRFAKSEYADDSDSSATVVILVLAPLSVWTVIIVGFLLYTIPNIDTLAKSPTGTYCHSTDPIWSQMGFTAVIVVSSMIVVIQAYLGYFIYRNSDLSFDNRHLFATAIRALVFGSIGILTLIVAIVYALQPTRNVAFDILLSIFPILALLTFGTQADLLKTWLQWIPWKRRPSYSPITDHG